MKFEIGDLVRIKQWDNMAAQYGGDEYYIPMPGAHFIDSMRNLCGKEFVITDIFGDEIEGHGTDWSITEFMLEMVEVEEDDGATYDSEEIGLFLSSISIKG